MQSSSGQYGSSTFSGFLDMKLQSSSCESWYFVWIFGYEDAEFILPKFTMSGVFWIRE